MTLSVGKVQMKRSSGDLTADRQLRADSLSMTSGIPAGILESGREDGCSTPQGAVTRPGLERCSVLCVDRLLP
jgi:hypothetical protein